MAALAPDVEKVKNEANEAFKGGHYQNALELYTKAIELDGGKSAILFGNRAFAYTRLEQYGGAVEDASKSIELDPKYAKAYYRRGSARLQLGKHKEALDDFKQANKIDPGKEAKEKLDHCQKLIRRLAFEAAIGIEEIPISQRINVDDVAVDSSYTGPHLQLPITLSFVTQLLEEFKNQRKIHVKYVYMILLEMKKLLEKLPTVLELDCASGTPFTVCGDIHGQFYDFLNILKINGMPSESNPYLWDGDFVDRGSFSCEVVLSLFALKLLYPNHFHLLRGNHETLSMNRMYGFEGEVEQKYSKKAFELFTEVFNWLPLGAVLGKKVFVTHGGLFSKDVSIQDLKNINRNRQPPDEGPMCEMLWSDPQPFNGIAPNKRGVAITFGPDITSRFLERNGLELVVRAHEVKEQGYLVEANGKLVTVFSAPNYCDQVGNKGAFIRFIDWKPNYVQYDAVPHPNVKPMAYANSFGLFQ